MTSWVFLNEKDPSTINCDQIRSFLWRDSDEDKYEDGELIVRFSSTGAYRYDVPYEVYEHMKKRAENPDDFDTTPFEWFDAHMIDYHSQEKVEKDGHLYVEKCQI